MKKVNPHLIFLPTNFPYYPSVPIYNYLLDPHLSLENVEII